MPAASVNLAGVGLALLGVLRLRRRRAHAAGPACFR
jgi:hypothetical protein